MSEETLEDIPIEFLEKFVILWEDVREAASVASISVFKARRNEFREFVKLFPCLKNQRIETIKEIIRERKINDILE
jgi:hypothetical protein